MLKVALFLFACCFQQCHAADNTMVIDSENAYYNGKTITLDGHVIIEHELGILTADKILLSPEVNDKKIRPTLMVMQENVKIKLKGGGQLCCSLAEIDFPKHQGKFLGNSEQEFVIYNELFHNKTTELPVTVKSRSMNLQIASEKSTEGSSGNSFISDIAAEDDVTVNYNNDFMAAADYAAYNRKTAEQDPKVIDNRMPGLISLRAKKEDGVCQITNNNGDIITSDHLCIDTVQRQLSFAYPKGALFTSNNALERNRLDFSSDTLTWEEMNNKLILRDHVNIHQQGIGTLITDKEVKITQEIVENKKSLSTIESIGTTVLTYAEADKDIYHILTAYGDVCVNHKALKTTMTSPKDDQGNVIEGKQIFFQDYMGEIYADKLTIDYVMFENSMKPVKLVLEGNVHVLNRCAVDPEQKGDFVQYALADIVEYTPQAKEIHLQSKEKGRVLFLDKLNNLQVSAPGLKIRRDEATKKESVQGFGNVRFNFLKQELDELNKQFSKFRMGQK